MRWVLTILALAVTALALTAGWLHPSASSEFCRAGLCRFDQLYSSVDSQGDDTRDLAVLLQADPSNPSAWATYAESLAAHRDTAGASQAFARAVELGPGISPVLMRAANFDFAHGDLKTGAALSQRILHQTDAFDEILFSYLKRFNLTSPDDLSQAIPPESRAASAWLRWIEANGSVENILDAWNWMKDHQQCDPRSAVEAAWSLFDHKAFRQSQELWIGWLGPAAGDYLQPDRLFNRAFETSPNASPYDWKIESTPAAQVSRDHGLEIRFAGNEAFSGVRQFTTVSPGRYRFSAEIEASGLASGQRPFFHIFDTEPARRLDVATAQVGNAAAHSQLTVDFTVPADVPSVEVELERRKSQAAGDSISGTLRIYRVSLLRL